ncbi:hypothetical protein Q5424_12165 [Conexibacter sp. JD483]|uniref:hypothetical protein n=1 Tax=unclassified Conexibacter TaxID=2627773 RepID=UPI0027212016|nr:MULTISPECIES: hypothetical protein [unclassified Conexibacter]MDO8187432.1 hypothetical protein [Conexibacter sp. CPCC 205706]MDO8198666.1 hypothetical protein [Conexibacter sp. CPCC 205762]MDR9369844.1 hypothetical protein [Conexibacter sp. JD483]
MSSPPFPSPRLTGVCLIVASLLLQAGYLVTPWEDEATTLSYHAALAGHPDQAMIAATLLRFGWVAWAPAAFGIVALLRPRGGWLLAIGGTLAIVGTVSMPGLLVTDFYDLALAQELPAGTAAQVSDAATDHPLLIAFQLPAVAGCILGTTLLFFALWRARVIALWVPLLVLGGWVVTFALPLSLLSFAVGGGLSMVGGIVAGVRIMRATGSDVRGTATPLPAEAATAVAA